jgi:hypothetical protein
MPGRVSLIGKPTSRIWPQQPKQKAVLFQPVRSSGSAVRDLLVRYHVGPAAQIDDTTLNNVDRSIALCRSTPAFRGFIGQRHEPARRGGRASSLLTRSAVTISAARLPTPSIYSRVHGLSKPIPRSIFRDTLVNSEIGGHRCRIPSIFTRGAAKNCAATMSSDRLSP